MRTGRELTRCVSLGGLLLVLSGCGGSLGSWATPVGTPAAAPVELADADAPFGPVAASPRQPVEVALPTTPTGLQLTVLHVQIPSERRATIQKIWNHLREDVLDSEVVLQLRRNGLRVGIGHTESWEAVRAALDAIPGHRVVQLDPVQLPPGFPLGLELDLEPREQTVFFVDRDGVLRGETWPQSRNVLRVTYTPDARQGDRVHLLVVPEVRQRLPGWRFVRTESGLWQVPKHDGRAYPAAGFALVVEPGEFVLVSPSERASVVGLIGTVMLADESDGERFDSLVFLRPDVARVVQRG